MQEEKIGSKCSKGRATVFERAREQVIDFARPSKVREENKTVPCLSGGREGEGSD